MPWAPSALAALLWCSLEPEDGDDLTGQEWEAAWRRETDRLLREVTEETIERVDGDPVDAEICAMLDAPSP